MSDPIKQSKFRLNAGQPKEARSWARLDVNNPSPQIAAMAAHRMAMASAALGNNADAADWFERAETGFYRIGDTVGWTIAVRDHELFNLRRCQLAHSSERAAFEADCLERLQQAVSELRQQPESKRVILEIAVTEAFITRARLLCFPAYGILKLRQQLSEDWETIRRLRGRTKPIYELDALMWVMTYGETPALPDPMVRRATYLAFKVGNPILMAKFIAIPVMSAYSQLFRSVFG